MAVGPDRRLRVAPADERVVRRHGAVRVDAKDLAEAAFEILRRVELESLAGGHEQLAVGREGEPAAEVIAAADLRDLAKDDREVAEPGRRRRRACPDRRRSKRRLRPARRSTDRRGGSSAKSGSSATSSRPPCPLAKTSGHPRERLRQRAARDKAKASRPLSYQHAAVGKKGQAPGMIETAGNGLDTHLRRSRYRSSDPPRRRTRQVTSRAAATRPPSSNGHRRKPASACALIRDNPSP